MVTLLAVLLCSALNRNYSSITLCMKSDYLWYTNVTYPNSCVNMDTGVMHNTGNANANGTGNHDTSYKSASKTIESVIVLDIDSSEDKCIIPYNA
ncbi:ACYPI38480 protein [Aphis craccivora]|uniref:ACYPI38480 protein n=1 Tax=Aphis craccivora TaxID=307492 RepID=A0A6G0WYR6_APHCR|nr:ACYPI38480 protein [Aphis craccivora]